MERPAAAAGAAPASGLPQAPPLDQGALQASFRAFLERPENLPLAEQALAEEARAASLAAERRAEARLRAAVGGLAPREWRRLQPALGCPSPALRGVLLSLCNPEGGGGDGGGEDPQGDAARLQAWLENPRVMDMLRRAAAAFGGEGGGGGGAPGGARGASARRPRAAAAAAAAAVGSAGDLDRLVVALAAGSDADAGARLPAHQLVEALNEHAREMALGRAALLSTPSPPAPTCPAPSPAAAPAPAPLSAAAADAALAHFARAAAAVAHVRPEDDRDSAAVRELRLARAAACAAQADAHAAAGRWAAAAAACDGGVRFLKPSGFSANSSSISNAVASLLARRCRASVELRDFAAASEELGRAREAAAEAGAGAARAWEQQLGALGGLLAAVLRRAASRPSPAGARDDERAFCARMLKGL